MFSKYLDTEIDLSFFIIKTSCQYGIGCQLGGNVSKNVYDRFYSEEPSILFQITDDPLDINADVLFSIDGIQIYSGDIRIDRGETLADRMSRVTNFFSTIINNQYVESVDVDINYGSLIEDADRITIRISEFLPYMLELYKKNINDVPSVKLCLQK